MFKKIVTSTICLLFAFVTVHAATIYVPDDYTAIQDAIDASSNGDEIVVRPGTYHENIKFYGKAVTVKSEWYAGITVIDGGQATTVVQFRNSEGPDSVLEGFTITNGMSTGTGGGVLCEGASPTIRNNIIIDNEAYDSSGGGIMCIYSASPVISNNVIIGNRAKYGGGISNWNLGGATIINNVICGNHASADGGAVSCSLSPTLTITNNTIFENSAGNMGGGVNCNNSATLWITNTILWNNDAPTGKEIYLGVHGDPPTVNVDYSDVCGGNNAPYVVVDNGVLNWGADNIDADPGFVEPSVEDFHLTYDSPCKDQGAGTAPSLPAEDFEGNPRVADSSADMGADEFYPHLYYSVYSLPGGVVPGATGAVKVVGLPGLAYTVGQSKRIQNPPLATLYGDLYLGFPITRVAKGVIPSNGAALYPKSAPDFWMPGTLYAYQALIGPELSNLVTVIVE